jgi:2-iminobutanoate/2-iminopropanoate deaminase
MIERISPPGIPAPRGPYSPAVRAGDFVFVSGQISVDAATNQISSGDIKHETRVVLNNIKRILEAASSSLNDVAKVNVYLADAGDFAAMNEVYAEFFGSSKPARATIICKFIADIKVEIDCTAYTPLGSPGA